MDSERDAIMNAEEEYIRQQKIRDQAAAAGYSPLVNEMIAALKPFFESKGLSQDMWNSLLYEEEKQFEEETLSFLNAEFPDASSDEIDTAFEIAFDETLD
tara:strand:+ start:88 stop:387 length:300 start_codon:yes stop_codon:yes gene_type:complete